MILTLATFLFFTSVVAALTWAFTRGDDHSSSSGYFLAGRQLTGPLVAGSLLLTNLSAEQMVGLNGAAFKGGLHVMVWEVAAVIALVLMATFFLPRYLKSGVATVPQFLEQRFDTTTRRIATVMFLLAYACILLPTLLYAGARGLSEMVDMSQLTGIQDEASYMTLTIVVVGVIGSIYALFGGLKAVAVSDTLNGVGLLAGGFAIAYFGLDKISDGGGAIAGWQLLRSAHPAEFNSIGTSTQSVPFATIFTGVFLLNAFYWCTNQQIIQRTLAASSLREGQQGVLLCGALKLLGPIYLVLPGIIAFHLYAGDPGVRNDTAYGRLVSDVLPSWMVGFFVAVVVGAILSSFNSALNSACTLFSLGIYKSMIRPDASESRVVLSGKVAGWVLAASAMVGAPMLMNKESIFDHLQKMNGLYFIPILTVVVVGMTTRRVPAVAAKCALLMGITLIAAAYFLPIGHKSATETKQVPTSQIDAGLDEGFVVVEGSDTVFEGTRWVSISRTKQVPKTIAGDVIEDYHCLGLVFVVLVMIMLGIGWARPTPQPWLQENTHQVDITPWRLALPVAALLVVMVLAIYWYFADFSVLSA